MRSTRPQDLTTPRTLAHPSILYLNNKPSTPGWRVARWTLVTTSPTYHCNKHSSCKGQEGHTE